MSAPHAAPVHGTDGERVPAARHARGRLALTAILATLSLLFVALLALGTWQVERLAWKRDLIRRVDARIHAAPVAAPAVRDWARVDAACCEYRHVRLHGRWLSGRDTRVQAVSARGAGWWLITPLQRADGSIVLVNRGFVGPDWTSPSASSPADAQAVVVDGLLRLDEPGGGFLRNNVPAQERWYSRDVAAIAARRGLAQVAPYFVDADRAAGSSDAADSAVPPVAGLTVVAFPNNHLSYAITWYALALLVAYAAWRFAREGRRLAPARRPATRPTPPTRTHRGATPEQ